MSDDVAQPGELLELSGTGVLSQPHVGWANLSNNEARFFSALQVDRSESIAELVPANLGFTVSESRLAAAPDCVELIGGFVVSTALKRIVEMFSVPNTEFFPTQLMLKPKGVAWNDPWETHGPILDGYWLMNCWNRVDIVDVEKSDVQGALRPVPGVKPARFTRWKKLVFDRETDQDIYGLVEHMPRCRFVSQRFAAAVEDAKLRARIVRRRTVLTDR